MKMLISTATGDIATEQTGKKLHIYIYIWVNFTISLTWIKAISGWFPLLTMIPVRSQRCRYNLPRHIYFDCQNQDLVRNCFLRVIPTLTHYSDMVSDIPSGSIYGIFMHIYSDILSGSYSDILYDVLSDILSGWHSFWHSIRHSIGHSVQHSLWHEFGSRPTPQHPELAIWGPHAIRSWRYGASAARSEEEKEEEETKERRRRKMKSSTFGKI